MRLHLWYSGSPVCSEPTQVVFKNRFYGLTAVTAVKLHLNPSKMLTRGRLQYSTYGYDYVIYLWITLNIR